MLRRIEALFGSSNHPLAAKHAGQIVEILRERKGEDIYEGSPFSHIPDQEWNDLYAESARQVLLRARQEAKRFKQTYVGAEHLFLGLAGEGEQDDAGKALQGLGVDLSRARDAVEFIIGHGEAEVMIEPELTPRARTVLGLANDERERLGHVRLNSSHLLLGIEREGLSIAVGALEKSGVRLHEIRPRVMQKLGQPLPKPPWVGFGDSFCLE